jgi:hypothetical protein
MTRSGLVERLFEQCPVMADFVAKVGDCTAVASQLTQTRHAAPSHSITSSASAPEPIVGKFSQEMLAEMIGTTRSRVSFFMNKFRKLGFIEYNGTLEVHSSLLNMVLHEKPEIKTRDEAISAE